MLKVDFANSINKENGLNIGDFHDYKGKLSLFIKKIHEEKQAFYSMLDDKETPIEIKKFIKNLSWVKNVVLLGIGGSALGSICLKDVFYPFFGNKKNLPSFQIIDNIDPDLISDFDKTLDYKKTLFLVITKSGDTVETLSLYSFFRKNLLNLRLPLNKHFVFVTGKSGFLKEEGEKEKIKTFFIPQNLSGRFSVLSAVGLLPAAIMGINIDKLLAGAKKMRSIFLSENFEENFVYKLALIQYLLYKNGKKIAAFMPYSQHLAKFADWYGQLASESLGKNGIGITPISALGPRDQHSQLQLYFDGPNDKLLFIFELENFSKKVPILSPPSLKKIFPSLGKFDFGKLIHLECEGTKNSLIARNRPFIQISINKLAEESLGELFMLFQGSIAFLGQLFEINVFNQPAVENAKEITKKILLK